MPSRYNELMQELTKNLQDAEYRFQLYLHHEDLEDAFCEGLQFSLEILKEEHFGSTDFYKKIEERESDCANASYRRRGQIGMDYGQGVDFHWNKFQALAKSLANEDPRHVQAKTIKFNIDIGAPDFDSEEVEEEI